MSADPHGLPLAEVERREREERRLQRVAAAIEIVSHGLVGHERCPHCQGLARAAIAAYPEPDVPGETTR